MCDEVCLKNSHIAWDGPNPVKARDGETPSHGYGMALIPEGEPDHEGGDFEGGGPGGAGPLINFLRNSNPTTLLVEPPGHDGYGPSHHTPGPQRLASGHLYPPEQHSSGSLRTANSGPVNPQKAKMA